MKNLIHGLALISGLAGFVLGCTEKLKESKPDLGVEATSEAIQAELNQTLAKKSPTDLQVGDAVLYEKNYRIELGPISKSAETLTYVFNRTETTDKVDLVLKEEETDFTTPDHPKKVTESSYEFDKVPPSKASTLPLVPSNLSLKATPSDSTSSGNAVTFHNLMGQNIDVELPPAVREKPNCMGFANCRVSARQTDADVVFWGCPQPSQCPNSFDKMHWTWVKSAQTPFLATDLSTCQQYLVDPPSDNSDRKYFVRNCEVLLDFGTKTP